MSAINRIEDLLGDQASLLKHECKTISKDRLHLPGPDFVDRVVSQTDRNPAVLRNLQLLFNNGRLGGTGYVSILPVDQGIEHTAGASFAPNPDYFDPSNICELAIEGGCNAVATNYGVLGSVARKYAHKIPFILKINHNELLTYPNSFDQIMFTNVDQAFDMGCVGVGATIYWGSENSRRQLQEVSECFSRAHELGMFTVLWCYLRNNDFKKDGVDLSRVRRSDRSGEPSRRSPSRPISSSRNRPRPATSGYQRDRSSVRRTPRCMSELTRASILIDLVRYQVANCYMGRDRHDQLGWSVGPGRPRHQAVRTAVINKRAGGMGLISGRKAFQKPRKDGIELLNAIQDVYLEKDVTIA